MKTLLRKLHSNLADLFTAPGRVYAIAAPVLTFEVGLVSLMVR